MQNLRFIAMKQPASNNSVNKWQSGDLSPGLSDFTLHPAASNIPQEDKTMRKKNCYCIGFSEGIWKISMA